MGQVSEIKAPEELEALIQDYSLLEKIHGLLDQGLVELEAAIGSPICIERCAKCCITPVALGQEASYIISTMSLLPSYQAIVTRALDWLDFNSKSRQCPFLDDDKRCMIYSVRPLTCRGYGITIAAHEWCPRPLHWTENATRRMAVGLDSPLGIAIKTMANKLSGSYALLPYILAIKTSSDKMAGLKPQSYKTKIGRGRVNLFWNANDYAYHTGLR